MATTKVNSFMGISSGTDVTLGNSGGDSGDAFDAVSGTVTVNTSADLTDAYDRGAIPTLSAATNAYVGWNVTGTTHYIRRYFRASSLGAVTLRLARFMDGATVRAELRLGTAGEILLTREDGSWVYDLDVNVSTSTIYRLEAYINTSTGAAGLRVFSGESTTELSTTTYWNDWTGTGSITQVRFGTMTTSTQTYSACDLAAVAYSDTDWLGPADPGTTVSATNIAATASVPAFTERNALVVMGGESKQGVWA